MTSKAENLLYLLGSLNRGIKRYSEGKALKEEVYSTVSSLTKLFSEDMGYFESKFAKIHLQFSKPLESPQKIQKVENYEKGLIKKYGLKHPSINNLAKFYARNWNKVASEEQTNISPFSSAEDFSNQLRTYTEDLVTQIDNVRKLKRKKKDKFKKHLLTTATYKFIGIVTPIANDKEDPEPPDGSSISVGRVFLKVGFKKSRLQEESSSTTQQQEGAEA